MIYYYSQFGVNTNQWLHTEVKTFDKSLIGKVQADTKSFTLEIISQGKNKEACIKLNEYLILEYLRNFWLDSVRGSL